MRRSSADTRSAIFTAARNRFAADGYGQATIRAIAADAGIDPAMVIRYFGTKDALFRAVTQLDLRLPDLAAVAPERRGAVLAAHLIERWEGDEVMVIMLRAGVTHAAVAERLRAIFATQLLPVVAAAGDAATARTRAGLVASQTLGLALCRYVLALPPLVAMDRDEVVSWIGPTLQRYLSGTAFEGEGS